MVAAHRVANRHLIDRIKSDASAFDFFRVALIVEAEMAESRVLQTSSESNSVRRRSEGPRIAVRPLLGFPPSEVEAVLEKGKDLEIVVSLPALHGHAGVLPQHYSELALEELRDREPALHSFLSAITERSLQLSIDAWCKHRLIAQVQRGWSEGGRPSTAESLVDSLIGYFSSTAYDRADVAPSTLRYFSGNFFAIPRSATTLAEMLAEWSQQRVVVNSNTPRWEPLRESEQTRIGSVFCHLGVDALVGTAVPYAAGVFEVALGPLAKDEFDSLLPGSKILQDFLSLIRQYVDPSLDFDIRLTLKKEEVPALQLLEAATAPRLGWSTWLLNEPALADVSDTVIRGSPEASDDGSAL